MRILIFARHYPPAVSGGAKRPFLLAQALRAAGVEVYVVAPTLPEGELGWSVPHANRDPATSADARRPTIRSLAREALLWPDPDIRWCLRGARAAVDSGIGFDWVLSTSPPESIHVAGEFAARRLGARWAADFRDLWLLNPHRLERNRWYRRTGEGMLARRLLPRAHLVTAVDSVVAKEVESLGAHSVEVLPHFAFNTAPAPMSLPEDRVNVVHAGSIALSDPQANIVQLLEPFERARRSNPALLLHLVGRLTDREATAIASCSSAADVVVYGPRPLAEALSMMAGADGLIFVASAKMHVPPSKIVDYLMFGSPIIATGQGPWRDDPRVPKGDATLQLRQLGKRSSRPELQESFSAVHAADLLLKWMASAAGSKN
jgi:glycosyltransferase involved in cell wall biosynthesis